MNIRTKEMMKAEEVGRKVKNKGKESFKKKL